MLERAASIPARLLVAIAGAIFLALAAAGFASPWQLFELKGYDVLAVAAAPEKSGLPITIVGIDEASFGQIGRQWPWPRKLYARLTDQLTKSGALVVAFDIVLAQPQDDADDQALADAIYRNDNVVLAADMAYQENAYARQWIRVEPHEPFKQSGGAVGFANVSTDGDGVVRKLPDGRDILWREIIRRANQRQPDLLKETSPPPDAMIGYIGPDHTFPYVSFYQALEADTMLPADVFRDQIVLVGKDLKASPDAGAASSDMFLSPFTARTGWFTPGVEIHANVLETAIRGNWFVPASRTSALGLLFATVVITALVMRRWRPLLSALVGIAILALLASGDWLLFTKMHVWMPIFAAALSVALLYVALGGYAFLSEQKRRGEIRRAFSLYVSGEVVDHVMAHPERLRLGGERREVTMLFTDLKGFTPLSEALGAEEVTRILNRHFSGATAIVKKHGGTVNRFIGDAVMAMWGAPLDDPEQALHACSAAVEMQEDLEKVRAELRAQNLPEIWMRVGIHSCTAVVGNLGSSDRFDYTAIGDGVNLAARLEGVNKLYGTGILVSGDTVEKIGGRLAMRLVDRVIVKGKSQAVEIFTPCADAAINELSQRAVAAYRKGLWEESEGLFREILARVPGDGVAEVYVDRIKHLRLTAVAAGWDGVVELEKL